MTQQQRIAAALKKAGIATPAAWAAAGVTGPAMQVSASPDTVSPNPEGVSAGNGAHTGRPQDRTPDGFETRPPVVLMKGTNNKTFLISWRSQQDVARSLGWKCTLMIWGGPALTLFCLYFLLEMTHLL